MKIVFLALSIAAWKAAFCGVRALEWLNAGMES